MPATSPKAVELTVHAFASAELSREFVQPEFVLLDWCDAYEPLFAGPRQAFYVFNFEIAHRNDLSAVAQEVTHFFENGLVNDICLKKNQNFVASAGQRTVSDEQFVQHIEFTKVS